MESSENNWLTILRDIFQISDFEFVLISLFILSIPIVISSLNLFINSKGGKDDRQFKVLLSIIESDMFITKLKNSSYLSKQLFFRNIYALKKYQVAEIEFLFEDHFGPLTLNNLDTLKKGEILAFKDDEYLVNKGQFTGLWIKHPKTISLVLSLAFFIISVATLYLIEIFASSLWLYVCFLIVFVFIEFLLIFKHEAIKLYVEKKDAVQALIERSKIFNNN